MSEDSKIKNKKQKKQKTKLEQDILCLYREMPFDITGKAKGSIYSHFIMGSMSVCIVMKVSTNTFTKRNLDGDLSFEVLKPVFSLPFYCDVLRDIPL